ncbi:MAG: hypothetical protein KJP07_02345 [Desulfatitalea sp.]|nr:hypothetical protein [Desulfatitalea sp.]
MNHARLTIPSMAQPPYDMVMSTKAESTVLIIWMVLAAAAICFCIYWSFRKRSLLPIVIEIGAGSAMIGEALIIHNMHCWYPAVNQNTIWHSCGQAIPSFIPFAYLFYFAPAILLLMEVYEKGISTKKFWLFYCYAWIGVSLYEISGTPFGVHTYYGNMPLYLFDTVPLVYCFTNACLIIIPSVVLFMLKGHLKGVKMLAVIPFMWGIATIIIWIGMPWFAAINSPVPREVTCLAGVLTIGAVLLVIHFLSGLVAKNKA